MTVPNRSKRKGKPTKKAPSTEKSYDAAVLAYLRETGPASSANILAAVGGTSNCLRGSLIRLASTGQIVRTGKTKLTRYELKGQG